MAWSRYGLPLHAGVCRGIVGPRAAGGKVRVSLHGPATSRKATSARPRTGAAANLVAGHRPARPYMPWSSAANPWGDESPAWWPTRWKLPDWFASDTRFIRRVSRQNCGSNISHLRTSTLILQGERDALGKGRGRHVPAIEDVAIRWLPDGDHSFKPRKASGRTEQQNWQDAINAVAGFVKASQKRLMALSRRKMGSV